MAVVYQQERSRPERTNGNSSCAGVAALAIAFLLAACSPAADKRGVPENTASYPAAAKPAAIAVPSAAQAAARMQECRAKLEAAIPLGLVANASVDNGRPIFWVGPAWRESTPEAKEELVRDAACFFLSGDESKTIKFSVYDTATDRELAVWNHTYLVFP